MRFAVILGFLLMTVPLSAQAMERKAVFAGGCFWCMEKPFEQHEGVLDVVSGFAGGHVENPTYKQVSKGNTGHIEVVEVTFDNRIIKYQDLLEIYWAQVDPVDGEGQFCDRGYAYKPAIFYIGRAQKGLIEESIEKVGEMVDGDVDVAVLPFTEFYPAEDYHQDYYKTHSAQYTFYRWRCGRDARLKDVWGDNATESIELFDTADQSLPSSSGTASNKSATSP